MDMYLDESGEFGFKAGSSKHLLIAILATSNRKKLKNAFRKEKKRLHDEGWPSNIEIKGTTVFASHLDKNIPKIISNNRISILRRIISKMVQCDGVTPHYAIINKSRVTSNLKNAPYGIAYNYYTGCLLCKVHDSKLNEDITLTVDQRNKETHAHMPFNGYVVTRVISDCNHSHSFSVSHRDSRDVIGLQAADFISWGLFRHYEHGDPQFRNLIAPSVGIRDNWYA